MPVVLALVISPAAAARAADAITRDLRRAGSHDVELAALVADLTAYAMPSGADSGSRRVTAPEPSWLTTAEYAAVVGITERTARARAQTGAVPARKDHGRWRITPAA